MKERRAQYDEPHVVVMDVAELAGVDVPYATSVLRDLHHVIDRLVADDWSILLGPLYLTMPGDPVLERIIARFTAEDWADPNGYKIAAPEELADYLGLPVEDVLARPPAFGTTVLQELEAWRGVDDEDDAEWTRLDTVVWAWRRRMDDHGVHYRVSPAGLEKDFDIWLTHNLDVIGQDYPVRIVAAQHRFTNKRRLDFLCQFTRDADPFRKDDLLVIENKANLADERALVQLREYIDLVESDYASEGQAVEGLLICDGTTVDLSRGLRREGLSFRTLSNIGYRDHLYRQAGLNRTVDDEKPSITASVVPLEGPLRPQLSDQAKPLRADLRVPPV